MSDIAIETLQQYVARWLKLDCEIKEINKKNKALKEEKDLVNDELIKFMEKHKIDMCKLPTGDHLVLKTQVQLGSINKEYIHDTLSDFFKKPHNKDPDKLAEETTDTLLNNRESSEKKVLRKVKGK